MSNNGMIRYECEKCGQGGAGVPGMEYPCHRCGHHYMTQWKPKPSNVKITKRTLQKLEKPK